MLLTEHLLLRSAPIRKHIYARYALPGRAAPPSGVAHIGYARVVTRPVMRQGVHPSKIASPRLVRRYRSVMSANRPILSAQCLTAGSRG